MRQLARVRLSERARQQSKMTEGRTSALKFERPYWTADALPSPQTHRPTRKLKILAGLFDGHEFAGVSDITPQKEKPPVGGFSWLKYIRSEMGVAGQ
jgi:hypothetical protein